MTSDGCCICILYRYWFRSGPWYVFAGLREQMSLVKIPEGMKGTPIALSYSRIAGYGIYGILRSCINPDDKQLKDGAADRLPVG